MRYQAASLDARGLAIYRGNLYMTSSYAAEPNNNMDYWPYNAW